MTASGPIEGNKAHRIGDGKYTEVNSTTMTPEKTKVVQEFCERAFKVGKSVRQVQKDVFFKFKCKIDFKQRPAVKVIKTDEDFKQEMENEL